MIAKYWRDLRGAHEGGMTGVAAALLALMAVPGAQAQTADPAAASGMTSGLPGVSTARQAELMQVRARAQAARPEAEQAAMERSAEDALAKKTQQQLLEETREIKQMKEQAARQLEHQRAANAYQGVTAGEISSWADDSGRVKVERGVPPEVLAALPPEEEPSAEELSEEDDGGFNPLKAPKKAMQSAARAAGGATGAVVGAAKKGFSWIPGVGKDDDETGITAAPRSQSASTEQVFDDGESKTMLQRIPLVGGMMKRKSDEPSPTASAPAPVEEEKKGFMRGFASKLPLVGDRNQADETSGPVMASEPTPTVGTSAPVAPQINPYAPPAQTASLGGGAGDGLTAPPAEQESGFFKNMPLIGSKRDSADTMAASAPQPTSADLPPDMADKPGMFGGIKGFVGKMVPGGSDRSNAAGPIDASLFPQDGDPEKLMADQSAGSEKKKFLKLPELPELSVPSIPSIPTPEAKQPMPKRTFSPGTFVVQKDGAQFMRFGAGPLGSEAQTLNSGTVVTKTKEGDEWSTIQLADGSTGIIRNGDLKASGGAAPIPTPVGPVSGGFANAGSSGAPARITSPVSATGAGVSDVPGPAVSVPTSSLTSGGGGSIPPASTVVPPIP